MTLHLAMTLKIQHESHDPRKKKSIISSVKMKNFCPVKDLLREWKDEPQTERKYLQTCI